MAVVAFTGRPPAEAVAFLRDKVPGGRVAFDWRDLWQQEHLTAFVAAKMTAHDLLVDVHGGLVRAISDGWARERFVAELRPLLVRRGWIGRQTMTDPATGLERAVTIRPSRRLRTIYDVNMRMAHAAGRWQRIEAAKAALPYLVYTAVLDDRVRDQHAKWGGRGAVRIILPVDHPFWRTHYPPNGWRCRCTVMQVSEAWLARRGLKVTTDEELAETRWDRTTPWLNRRTGQMMTVPHGIDPGFGYNVGLARRAGLTPPPTPEPQRAQVIGERYPRALPPAPTPRPYPAGVGRRPELGDAGAFDAFARTLGVREDDVWTDRAQIPLVIGRDLFQQRDAAGRVVGSKAAKGGRAELAQIIAATLADPDEIWIAAQGELAGGTRLTRYYVAAWDDPEAGRIWVTVGFTRREGWWVGTTAFAPHGAPPKAGRYTDKNGRVGTLVYRRAGPRA